MSFSSFLKASRSPVSQDIAHSLGIYGNRINGGSAADWRVGVLHVRDCVSGGPLVAANLGKNQPIADTIDATVQTEGRAFAVRLSSSQRLYLFERGKIERSQLSNWSSPENCLKF